MTRPRGNAWYRKTYTHTFADGRDCEIDYDVDTPALAGLPELSTVRVAFSTQLLRTIPDHDLLEIMRGIAR